MKPPEDFPVICVGGSAGGLQAFAELLQHPPSGCIDFILAPQRWARL